MTDPTRGARPRRGGRRPGWVLLTVLLVLAIAASSALVFTNRVELLKLAVILALWAAVVAAFVSVIYRRQSDIDQAKVRDLKLVYDLQLDREISARREYELSVETQLRRELASELRAQAADEVAALRAELAALRANLEILFDADLSHRPAIETDRAAARASSDWSPSPRPRVGSQQPDRHRGSRGAERPTPDTDESPIIDVPDEPHPPEDEWSPPRRGRAVRIAGRRAGAEHRRPAAEQPRRGRRARPRHRRRRRHHRHRRHRAATAAERRRRQPEPQFPWPPPPHAAAARPPEPAAPAAVDWQPAPAEGQWIPPGAPGSNWVAPAAERRNAPTRPSTSAATRAAAASSPQPATRTAPGRPPQPHRAAEADSAGPPRRRRQPAPASRRRRAAAPPSSAARRRRVPTMARTPVGSRSPTCWPGCRRRPSGGGRRRRREE